jgi:hypothetical protein
MVEKAQKIKYQCVWDGRVFDSEEQALRECDGPIQAFIQNHDRYPKRGFFGTVTWRKKKR